ncbi:hypothetical protein MTO98_27505 [Mucilaginibacter sp. SMC90]|uniref:hypothetical protein n=1 Tax=Mucilaginibacter sp. SMC90 TaxID=2929803 RepID=UPI001FB333DA|nr:hypothetical protein [Mucilaginibacter sp. SMC90]UOE48164.1 hypothetical protein MTO98_27505 [Mucilaginibacter sp. SMC90]
MKLRADESKWIEERMKVYEIKYRNVYNEILDHVMSAIEERRRAGDSRDIESLFQQVVDMHLGGTDGIKKLVVEHENIYKEGLKKLWVQSLNHYLTWPMLGFAIVVLLLSLKLPDVGLVKSFVFVMYILMACSPTVYAYFLFRDRVMTTVDGKLSFFRMHLIKKASISAAIFFNVIYLVSPGIIANTPIIILVIVMMLFTLLNLASIHFCRQFKSSSSLSR